MIMVKSKTKFILICAIIIYIIALVTFHLDYVYNDGYVKYEMCDEPVIVTLVTIVFAIITIIIVTMAKRKNTDIGAKVEEKTTNVAQEKTIEKVSEAKETLPIATKQTDENEKYIGTGVIGLTNYVVFCQYMAALCVGIGLILLVASKSIGLSGVIFAIYFITAAIGCLILSVILKAFVTITKAAKLYLDLNQKEEK